MQTEQPIGPLFSVVPMIAMQCVTFIAHSWLYRRMYAILKPNMAYRFNKIQLTLLFYAISRWNSVVNAADVGLTHW